jgi:hypothetical protein
MGEAAIAAGHRVSSGGNPRAAPHVEPKWLHPDAKSAKATNRAVFGAAQSRFGEAIIKLKSARSRLDNASLALQASTDEAFAAGMSMDVISAKFRANADSIVSVWWNLHDELIQTQNHDGGYPAWFLKSPEVKYTDFPGHIIDAAGDVSSDGSHECAQPAEMHALKLKVAELEQKVRQLQDAAVP